MFIIDFSSSESGILSSLPDRDIPSWFMPVADFIRMWFSGEPRFPVKTSGSTGTPKEIFHSREAMIASAERTSDFFGLKAGDTALLALPATYIGGKMMIVRSIVRGLRLICMEPKSNPFLHIGIEPPKGFGQEFIEFGSFTPMQMSAMLNLSPSPSPEGGAMQDSKAGENLSHIRKIILGGGEVSYSLRQRLQAIPSVVYETYGMTETISHIALKKINGRDKSDYFTVLDGVKISLDDRNCLVIDAPHLSDELVVTNDIVNLINDKQFQWIGRYDNVINTGGIKVYAEEIERKLQGQISENFFITGMADDHLGQAVALILESVTPDEGREAGLAAVFARHLGKYEKPRKILTVEKFVYTETGKVNKAATVKVL